MVLLAFSFRHLLIFYEFINEQVEEMLRKDSIDWEAELHRLVEPAPGSEKGVMLIEGGSLAVYNAYDRRFDS